MTYMRALTSLKFGQIRLLVPMTTDRVIMEKTVLPLFLDCFFSRTFSYLQVMMTCMRARRSLKFGQILLLVAMTTDRVIMEKTVLPLFLDCFFPPILFILAGNDDMHESLEEFEIWPDPTTGSHDNR